MLNWLTQLQEFVMNHTWLAPIVAIFLPFLEAVIPSLPLTVLVSFNITLLASVYGNVGGTFWAIFLSTFGSLLGMVLIFLLIRYTLGEKFAHKVQTHKYGSRFLNIVNGPNTFLVWVLLANPFLPSAILNYALSLTNIKFGKYLWLTASSRLVIMLFLVFLGSLFNIQEHPLNIILMLGAYMIMFGIWGIWARKTHLHEETHEKK